MCVYVNSSWVFDATKRMLRDSCELKVTLWDAIRTTPIMGRRENPSPSLTTVSVCGAPCQLGRAQSPEPSPLFRSSPWVRWPRCCTHVSIQNLRRLVSGYLKRQLAYKVNVVYKIWSVKICRCNWVVNAHVRCAMCCYWFVFKDYISNTL